jgi:hypothetical protein
MLFIKEYNAKSLDRSSVSMIDKYNTRLGRVSQLLIRLSALIDNLLSLIRDVRNTLGKCKQRVYDNLNQVKEVISGNNIKGTESTVQAIEDALKAGDEAIARAESTLQGVQKEMECNEEPGVKTQPEGDCGEPCNEVPSETETTDCDYCDVTTNTISDTGTQTTTCQISINCQNDISCNEPACFYTITGGGTYTTTIDNKCDQITSVGAGGVIPPTAEENCTFYCTHSTPCQESPMPHNCTYSCADSGCNYTSNDCAYGTICNMTCDQPAPEIEACGNCGQGYGCGDWSEFCGEVGGGSTGKGDEGCGDCGDCGNCGQGEGCGDWSEFCGE